MAESVISSFLYEIGFAEDPASRKKAQDAVSAVEKSITAISAAEVDKRVKTDRKGISTRTAAVQQLNRIIELLEQDRADKVDAIQKEQSARAAKRDDEDVRKAVGRRDALLKSTKALTVGMFGLVTGLAVGVTGAATGLLWATDRAAKHFERLAIVARDSGASAAGLSRFSYAASQLGDSAENAQQSVANFGENLKKLPALEGILKGMGIATRDANGHLREASELTAEYIDHLKDLPQLQREARASAWGISEATVRAGVQPQFKGLENEYDRVQGAVGANPNAAAQGAVGFEQAMRRGFEIIGAIKTRVETSLFEIIRPRLDDIATWVLDHGTAISNVVTAISKGMTDLATAFVKSDVVQGAIGSLGDALERFAKYVGSSDFKKDIDGFVTDVQALAKAIRSALEWLGILPSRSGASAASTPAPFDASSDPATQGQGIWNRGFHGRDPRAMSSDQRAYVRGKRDSFDGVVPTGAGDPLKALIAEHETGTAGPGGYDTVYGHAERGGALAPPKPITQMTIGEILAYQHDMKPRSGAAAFTVGRAQWTESTLRGLTRGMDPNTVFSPEVQEKLFDRSIAGRMDQGAQGFRSEWDSFRGLSDGQINSAIEGHRQALAHASSASDGDIGSKIASFKSAGLLTDEQCVTLAMASAGITKGSGVDGANVHDWRKGVGADEGSLTSGTPVATFLNRDGSQSERYAGGGAGTPGAHLDHAGIFQKYLTDEAGKRIGMQIAEQFQGSNGVHLRNYMFGSGAGEANGSNYHAVLGSDGKPLGGVRSPLKVDVTDASAAKLGKGFASSFPAGTMPQSDNTLARLHASWQKHSANSGFEVPPLGVTPSLMQSYDHSRRKGDTTITHNPTFNINGGDTRSTLDTARMVADRGTRDLVRNLKPVEQ